MLALNIWNDTASVATPPLNYFLPEACGTTLEHVIAYQLDELNAILKARAKSGQQYFKFYASDDYPTNDEALRTHIIQTKERLHISFRRWVTDLRLLAAFSGPHRRRLRGPPAHQKLTPQPTLRLATMLCGELPDFYLFSRLRISFIFHSNACPYQMCHRGQRTWYPYIYLILISDEPIRYVAEDSVRDVWR